MVKDTGKYELEGKGKLKKDYLELRIIELKEKVKTREIRIKENEAKIKEHNKAIEKIEEEIENAKRKISKLQSP